MPTIGVIKKVFMTDVEESWGDEYYILLSPLTHGESRNLRAQMATLKGEGEEVYEKQEEVSIELVKKHVIGGKVPAWDETTNKQVEADFNADLLEQLSSDMVVKLFNELVGAKYDDPKASTEKTQPVTPPNDSESTTETSSSEDSQKALET